MGRQRKTITSTMKDAIKRIAGLQAIDPALDFGSDKSIVKYQEKLTNAETALNVYNTQIAELDELLNEFNVVNNTLGAYNTEMLSAVKAIYGRDSNEYEQAGGTLFSERKKRKSTPPENNG